MGVLFLVFIASPIFMIFPVIPMKVIKKLSWYSYPILLLLAVLSFLLSFGVGMSMAESSSPYPRHLPVYLSFLDPGKSFLSCCFYYLITASISLVLQRLWRFRLDLLSAALSTALFAPFVIIEILAWEHGKSLLPSIHF